MIDEDAHHRWLSSETQRLIDFYQAAADPRGGFGWLDDHGQLTPGEPIHLWLTARMVHCFAIADILGVPGARGLVEHGLSALDGDGCLHDSTYGGWYAAHNGEQAKGAKHAYGHAQVLLAAASAMSAGLPEAGRVLDRALMTIDNWFWRDTDQLCVDGYTRDWGQLEPYRSANTNLHLAEAYLAAAEATGHDGHARRAEAITRRIIAEFGAASNWRLPAHFDAEWQPLPNYRADRPGDYDRPYGSTIGHWLEWIRILMQLHQRPGGEWVLPAARQLFDRAVGDGWNRQHGGFAYSVDPAGRPVLTDQMHWVLTEAIGAAVALYRATGDTRYDVWYRRFWDHAETRFLDLTHGSWFHQLHADHRLATHPWHGKPDLYHTLQATLYARIQPEMGIAAATARGLTTQRNPSGGPASGPCTQRNLQQP